MSTRVSTRCPGRGQRLDISRSRRGHGRATIWPAATGNPGGEVRGARPDFVVDHTPSANSSEVVVVNDETGTEQEGVQRMGLRGSGRRGSKELGSCGAVPGDVTAVAPPGCPPDAGSFQESLAARMRCGRAPRFCVWFPSGSRKVRY